MVQFFSFHFYNESENFKNLIDNLTGPHLISQQNIMF